MKKGSAGDDVLGPDIDQGDRGEIETNPREDSRSSPDAINESQPEKLESMDEESSTQVIGDPPQPGRDDDRVPWVYARSNVKEDRDMVQYYLRRFVQEAEDDLVDAVENELETELTLTDVREAAVIAAMRNPELVAAELDRWGFESKDT